MVLCAVLTLAASAADTRLPTVRTNVRPLQTAVTDSVTYVHADTATAFAHTRAAGTSFVRLGFGWKYSGPGEDSRTKPKGFNPADPNDPQWDWPLIDKQVRAAVANGLEPIATLYAPPPWGHLRVRGVPGLGRPDPRGIALFARAAARRYSGAVRGIPRVRYWEAWNEPNHVGAAGLKKGAGTWYRSVVNRVAAAVDSVHPDNIVIGGSTAPFETQGSVAPLQFMRELLCVKGGERPRATCSKKARFDIWAHHPYTSGAPTREAGGGDDVSIGDLPQMHRLLQTAIRAGHVITKQRVPFWVTEFGWDTNPPDPGGVPIALQTRWTAEAMYRMWASGVSMVTWFRLRDDPLRRSFYQSGLYYRGPSIARDRAKPTLYAFRFPFVAFQQDGRVFVWGRTPAGKPGRVAIEQLVSGGWRSLGRLRSDRYGIFSRIYATSREGKLRARFLENGERSVPFSLEVPPDKYYPPFGS